MDFKSRGFRYTNGGGRDRQIVPNGSYNACVNQFFTGCTEVAHRMQAILGSMIARFVRKESKNVHVFQCCYEIICFATFHAIYFNFEKNDNACIVDFFSKIRKYKIYRSA